MDPDRDCHRWWGIPHKLSVFHLVHLMEYSPAPAIKIHVPVLTECLQNSIHNSYGNFIFPLFFKCKNWRKKNLKTGNIRTQMISNSLEFHHFVCQSQSIVELSKTLKIVIGQRILKICIGDWSFHHSAIQDSKSF